jgi:hypothetical protein
MSLVDQIQNEARESSVLNALADWLEERNVELAHLAPPFRVPYLAYLALTVRYGATATSVLRTIKGLGEFVPGDAAEAYARTLASRDATPENVANSLAELGNALHRDAREARTVREGNGWPDA